MMRFFFLNEVEYQALELRILAYAQNIKMNAFETADFEAAWLFKTRN